MLCFRFIAVRFPFKARILCTPRRSRLAVIVIAVSSFVYTIPFFFTSKWFPESRTCVTQGNKDTLSTSYGWLTAFLNSVIPFSTLLTLNIIMIVTIRNRMKYFKKEDKVEAKSSTDSTGNDKALASTSTQNTGNSITNGSNKASSEIKPNYKPPVKNTNSARERQLVTMLLLATFTFLVLTLPLFSRNIAILFWDYQASAETYANYIMIVHLFGELYFMNSAVNFYLYCLGGRKFRQDLRTVCCCSSEKRGNGIEMSDTNTTDATDDGPLDD